MWSAFMRTPFIFFHAHLFIYSFQIELQRIQNVWRVEMLSLSKALQLLRNVTQMYTLANKMPFIKRFFTFYVSLHKKTHKKTSQSALFA